MPASMVRLRLERRSVTDFGLEVLAIILNRMFLVGVIFILPGIPERLYNIGVWLFIIASSVLSALSFKAVCDVRVRDNGDIDKPAKHVVDRHLFCETMMYAIAGIVFTIGTFLFLPGLYWDEAIAWDWNTAAAWMFIIGSLCFVAAGLHNAMNIHHDRYDDGKYFCQVTPYNLSVARLYCGVFGSVIFAVGLFYFRPAGELQCEYGHVGRWCRSSSFTGAWCFIIGSILFVAQTVLSLVSAVITQRGSKISSDESLMDDDARLGTGGMDF